LRRCAGVGFVGTALSAASISSATDQNVIGQAECNGWHVVRVGSRLPLIKIAHLDETADRIRQRTAENLSAQPQPEFRDVVIVRDRSGVNASMPPWVRGFLNHIWS
jgi:hypothetical protein